MQQLPSASPSSLDGSDLDKDLLAALDEMLSFSPAPVPPVAVGCHLVDAFAPLEESTDATDSDMDALLLSLDGGDPAPPEKPTAPRRGGKDTRAAPYPKTKPRRRKRPKDELDYLRTQVTDLEEELANMAATSNANSHESGTEVEGELFLRWKQIADRQKQEADRSVVENLKLRARLEGQLQVARSLEAAINQHQKEAAQLLPWHRVKAELNAGAASSSDSGSRQRATSMSDDAIFAELDVGLEAQYADLDMVFEATGLAHMYQDTDNGIQMHCDGNGGISFRHEEAHVLPFAMPAVHRAMWNSVLGGASSQLLGRVHTRAVNDDHLYITIVDTLQLPKSRRIDVCARLATRRYFEKDRVVAVWRGYVEIAGSVFVRLREKGYNSVSTFDFHRGSRAGATGSSSNVPGCVMRMALQVTPERTDFDSEQEAQTHIGEMSDLVVGTYHRNFGLMMQVVENLLFKDATGGEVLGEAEAQRFSSY
ncbi:hypothetical protein BBJ28_00024294 [Nothophytophthora sp. Chile5]|nr:hypothetical protein BBJ28_00024294 [Nothophytophthora sp. Chile5]